VQVSGAIRVCWMRGMYLGEVWMMQVCKRMRVPGVKQVPSRVCCWISSQTSVAVLRGMSAHACCSAAWDGWDEWAFHA
jgi:hypothetical protein